MIGKSQAILLALLLAMPTVLIAVAVVSPTQAQNQYTIWMKLTTSAWKGASYGGAFFTPVRPVGTTFPERYNVTHLQAYVEVWQIKPTGAVQGGTFTPNATGFVPVSWPADWENVTIVVKAKSYQGQTIGSGAINQGIIEYWLTVNPSQRWWQRYSFLTALSASPLNVTVNDDGFVDAWADVVDMQTNRGRAGLSSGPFDVVEMTPAAFADLFDDPRNAWVARVAKIFKVFHEHTWYSPKDNLSYAMVFIYDLDHTPANSEAALLQACITGAEGDGQCRYTREIYPWNDDTRRRYQDNIYVPIPLQIMNLRNQTPYHGGIVMPEKNWDNDNDGLVDEDPVNGENDDDDDLIDEDPGAEVNVPRGASHVGAPHLNATKRVWWETVLVNQTLYAGREYNGTGHWYLVDPLDPNGKRRPDFGAYPTMMLDTDNDGEGDVYASPTITQGGLRGVGAGPLSIVYNHTVTVSTSGNSYRFAAATELPWSVDVNIFEDLELDGDEGSDDSITVGFDTQEIVCTFMGFIRGPSQTGTVRCAGWVKILADYDGDDTVDNVFLVWVDGSGDLEVEFLSPDPIDDPDFPPNTFEIGFSSDPFRIVGESLVDADLDGRADDRIRIVFEAGVSSDGVLFSAHTSELVAGEITVEFTELDEELEIDLNNDGSDEVKEELVGPVDITIDVTDAPIALGDEIAVPFSITLEGEDEAVDYDGDDADDDVVSARKELDCVIYGAVDEKAPDAVQTGWIECIGRETKRVVVNTPDGDEDAADRVYSAEFTVRGIGLVEIDSSGGLAAIVIDILAPEHVKIRGQAWRDMDSGLSGGDTGVEMLLDDERNPFDGAPYGILDDTIPIEATYNPSTGVLTITDGVVADVGDLADFIVFTPGDNDGDTYFTGPTNAIVVLVEGEQELTTTRVLAERHLSGVWIGKEVKFNYTSVNFNNNTVFYTRICVQDSDLNINHPDFGDKMFGAEVTINFKTKTDTPYYLSHNIDFTDNTGCAGAHKWPGNLVPGFFRYPNGTEWYERGSLNVTKHFDPVDDRSPAMSYFEESWASDNYLGPKRNAGGNYSALIPEIGYMKTRTLTDDKDWDGFNVQVKWGGGPRDRYGWPSVLVDELRVNNPYALALFVDYKAWDNIDDDGDGYKKDYGEYHILFGEWVMPYTPLEPSCTLVKFHDPVLLEITTEQDDTITAEAVGEFCITGLEYLDVYLTYDQHGRPYVDTDDFEVSGMEWGVLKVKDGKLIVDGEEVAMIGEIEEITNLNATRITVKADNSHYDLDIELGGDRDTGGLIDLGIDQQIDATNIAYIELEAWVGEVELTQHGTVVVSAFDADNLLVEDNRYDEIFEIEHFVGSFVARPVLWIQIEKWESGSLFAEDTVDERLELEFQGSHNGLITGREDLELRGITKLQPIGSRARITDVDEYGHIVYIHVKHDGETSGQIFQGQIYFTPGIEPDDFGAIDCADTFDSGSIAITTVNPPFSAAWTGPVSASGTFQATMEEVDPNEAKCVITLQGTWSGEDDPTIADSSELDEVEGTYTLSIYDWIDGQWVLVAQVSGEFTGTGDIEATKDPNTITVTINTIDFIKVTSEGEDLDDDLELDDFYSVFDRIETNPLPDAAGIGVFNLVPWTDVDNFRGTFTMPLLTSTDIELYGMVVPLEDQDFGLFGTGHVYVSANVHDLAFIIMDNMGNPLPASRTTVTLTRLPADRITLTAGPDPEIEGSLARSYRLFGDGYAVFYQLPGEFGYGLTVTFEGQIVYDNPEEVPKLEKTEIIEIHVEVYKVKLLFIDCEGQPIPNAYIRLTHPTGRPGLALTDRFGAVDYGYAVGGELSIRGLWWKGVWVTFAEAKIGNRQLPLRPDGTLTINIDRNIDSPIVLTALINNFIFTTWDYNKDNRIPRLNITLTWVGEHPFTGRRLYFLQTLDPTGDAHGGAFNTSLSVQFLNYTVRAYFQNVTKSAGLKTYGQVDYVFFKMPSTYYNITVTTVTDPRYDQETEQTPSNSKWPGRKDAAVDYEIKIDFNFRDLTKPWSIRTTPKETVNDRVVLRVFGTIAGRPVTDPDLNPIGNATLFTTCGPKRIDLLTWAHTFYKRVVDGDFSYLADARRIGNATFRIKNDNGIDMEEYYPETRTFSTWFTSKWTDDLLDTTRLKAESQHCSNIWWNGSYAAYDLRFLSYVYPLEFTRGEQPWARFYNRVGLTGTGIPTTEQGPLDADNDPEATPTSFSVTEFFNVTTGPTENGKSRTHNFTVVGSEGLWNQQRWRWERAVARNLVPEVPTRPYSLVFEKQVVTFPIPVGFITLNLKDEDLARAIAYAVVQLNVYRRVAPPPPAPPAPDPSLLCQLTQLTRGMTPAQMTAVIASHAFQRINTTITDTERVALCVEIYGQLTDVESPDAIDSADATSISTMLNLTIGGGSRWNVTEVQLFINQIKGLMLDGVASAADMTAIEGLARAYSGVTVDLDFLLPPPPPPAAGPTEVLVASYLYKTGREGNLTLLYPTQEAMENILGAPVINYTLTVYWYLNSSIVYKDAFLLTKRGYTVDKVAIADVTFVLAVSADKDRPVKDLYARIWWFNVTDGSTTFPGRIAVDHARRTWTYTAVPETRGAAKWTTGSLTLPWLPTSERFTKSDWDLVYDADERRWVYDDVTRTWDIPYPSNADGSPLAGWPYAPRPTSYYRALTFEENRRIQYRISVWSDQLPIDPTSVSFGRGAWSRAAPEAAARDHYELVWTRLSTGDTTPPIFPFAWMLFGEPPFDITWYRGSDGLGGFEPIPGYALTKTSVRTPSPGSKTVAIKLNATDIEIPVFWQVGDLELGTYDCGPLVGYRVTGSVVPPRGATFPAVSFDRTTAPGRVRVGDKVVDICLAGKDVGLVSLRSGDTPSTVFWGGSTLRITAVAPPESIWADSTSPSRGRGTWSDYWRAWISRATDPLTGQPVQLVVGDQIGGPDLGIQYMGYGTAFEGAPREIRVIAFSNDPENRAHRPFIKMFEFQNVSARITDFNGRPLPGAFYQLVDAQTGKSAAWSYAGPDGRTVPMPIRKPGGVFIQRVLYLGQGANGVPTWPVNSFTRWPVAYDSRDDETTQETQKPDIPLGFAYTAEAGPWPVGSGWRQDTFAGRRICELAGDWYYPYERRFLEVLASCPPSGWGRSFDVITRIFDLRIRFVYGDAQRPADPAYEFSSPSLGPLPDAFNVRGQGAIFEARRLVRGTYDIVAFWPGPGGEEVGRRTFDISRANVGTVEGTVTLALRDISFAVVDRQGRPLSGARVSVSPELVRSEDIQLRPDSIFTILRVPDGRTYDFTVEWTSVYGTTARAAVRESPAGLESRGSITVPVDDISIKVVDFDDRPVAGAQITFGGQAVGATDSMGVIVVGQVPLDNEYTISVRKEGTEIGSDRVRFTASRLSATIQAGVYDVTVLVRGAAGQPIQGATVELVRGGTTIATQSTDESGSAVFSKVVGADYTVRARYEQFARDTNIARGVRSATLTLDLYTVLLGVPMTFATFLALIIGLILLVIVIVVIVSEYIRWRGRRLGIYPPAPPKK